VELIETSIFTKQVRAALSDDEYRELQLYLVLQPDAGDLIPGSGGLRKVRWRLTGRGKRGGVRVIYFWKSGAGQLYLLCLYAKSEHSDLTTRELRLLRAMVTDD
jgi:mRNA-degrading endonuclease RelE of RelBE toxin-antitoxin system